ncbi:MAG: SDR family oxidoreductase [Proteobacteria bacterium]|nr:MAG: SDR family oxidoreductase [Pseudomonadota bacterium]
MTLSGKVIIITGASSGIGEAAALLLAERGAAVVLGARNAEKLEAVVQRIREAGGNAAALSIDVKKRTDLLRIVDFARETHGKIDVFISNAGNGAISPLDELRVDDWDDMIDINIKGVLYGIAAALPVFRKQRFGHFIHTGSTAAHRTVPTMAVYSGTKSAVRAITEGLRQEAGKDLRVTLISPGYVKTNFADSVTSETLKLEVQNGIDQVGISPKAIARAMIYAIEQPLDVDVGEIIIRPTAQG